MERKKTAEKEENKSVAERKKNLAVTTLGVKSRSVGKPPGSHKIVKKKKKKKNNNSKIDVKMYIVYKMLYCYRVVRTIHTHYMCTSTYTRALSIEIGEDQPTNFI